MDTYDLEEVPPKIITVKNKIIKFKLVYPNLIEKYEIKLTKLRHCIELELKERKQIEGILDYFTKPQEN